MASGDTVDKVYHAQETTDAPFPLDDQGEGAKTTDPVSGAASTGKTYGSSSLVDRDFPRKKVAVELLSSALNTRSKKILQQFEFTKSGAIQVGEYKNGLSGDIRVSPNGIVARDNTGSTTFALDGETGDATFAGEIRSGTLITGSVTVGNGSVVIDGSDNGSIVIQDSSGNTIIDATGLRSTTQFQNTQTTEAGTNQSFTSSSYVDATSSSRTFSLGRSTMVLFLITTSAYLVESVGNTGNGLFSLNVDGNIISSADISINSANNYLSTRSSHYITTLAAGSHTVKLQGKITATAGSPSMTLYTFTWTYLLLGT